MTLTLTFSCVFFVDAHSRWMTWVTLNLPVATLRQMPSSHSTPHRRRRGARKSPSTVPTRRPKDVSPYARLLMRTSYRQNTQNQEARATIMSSFAVVAELLTRLMRLRLLTRCSMVRRRPSSATSAPRKLLTARRWLQIMRRTKRRLVTLKTTWLQLKRRRPLRRLSRIQTPTIPPRRRTVLAQSLSS